jgi:hypothetical protein
VLQTTAGKMIFGRYLDPGQSAPASGPADERPRSRSHVPAPASSAPGSSPVVTPVATTSAAPVSEPAPRAAATPLAGK